MKTRSGSHCDRRIDRSREINRDDYNVIEQYMLECMEDSAHDREHIYRVLYVALDIARTECNVDYDVLITSCLLHDIGRKEQFENPTLCHAEVGAEKAFHFLIDAGYENSFAGKVSNCIRAHRFRSSTPPDSLESKILFDADKIDVTGALGIARTLAYTGKIGEPLYSLESSGKVSDGVGDTVPSFFQEYKYKLENLYSGLFTSRGKEIAAERQNAAVSFYNAMLEEVSGSYQKGASLLRKRISPGISQSS